MVTKVKTVESYEDSQGKHIVAKGKLVLIEDNGPSKLVRQISNGKLFYNKEESLKSGLAQPLKPLIISETEEIEVGDKVLWLNQKIWDNFQISKNGWYLQSGSSQFRPISEFKKILVLPEQFSKAHLQAIVDSKMKDGDEVFVGCEVDADDKRNWYIDFPSGKYHDDEPIPPSKDNLYSNPKYYKIELFLPEPGHVKLFPVKKEESWDDIFHKYWNEPTRENTGVVGNFKEWFQANYNSPTKR